MTPGYQERANAARTRDTRSGVPVAVVTGQLAAFIQDGLRELVRIDAVDACHLGHGLEGRKRAADASHLPVDEDACEGGVRREQVRHQRPQKICCLHSGRIVEIECGVVAPAQTAL